MKHFLLKFNYGVEIGAYLAYSGHYKATGDPKIRDIAREELGHRMTLRAILAEYGEKPSPHINRVFKAIGSCIRTACRYSPDWALNFVASRMEIFAIFSYSLVAKRYPKWRLVFECMAEAERIHKEYFENNPKVPTDSVDK